MLQMNMMDDPGGPAKTLYVGNLDAAVSEELLYMLFSQFGMCMECKILREAGHDPYAFIKYTEHQHAQAALMAMNKRNVLGRELKVNWASHPGTTAKQDTTNHYHIYVGDLSPDIDVVQIKNAFVPFGEISDCKIIRDPHTQMSKGYAFVCFVRKEDAENAIVTMNGQWLGGRTIKTNWASGKGNMMNITKAPGGRPMLDYDEVYNQSSPTNVTIYIAGVQTGLTDELLRETFSPYGNIVDIRIFKEKCYAFVRMDKKESACNGIVGVHGTDVNGYPVKCSWGKDPSDLLNPSPSLNSSNSSSITASNSNNNSIGSLKMGALPSSGGTAPMNAASPYGANFPPNPYSAYYQQMAYWQYPQMNAAYMNAYNQQVYAAAAAAANYPGSQWPASNNTANNGGSGGGAGDGFYGNKQ
ncbi:hypothetical protein HELRODRAFT_186005 [Helobdella robusta]|uniref:RRM domain-containing protein n=1 Tax=Helobdella robusta TaxID=6412 RepID=T1FNJ4_HELRO|nr:hypothetical protein HELRODRAFT_186005 [Helobdella robusta]ESN95132.1 hypothetical protein HELRODRAFT_186005 [Helobdella robusta]